ncbi:hypothetical protein LSTR_LSTR013813 [Laodelphax striatellus]|uniref:Nose resistant-to-fluoxetine protein N-terminal domain-containing protein n=1 Tax=Laodelphax striatellus TaxID=195883 RepID=A0A482XMH8_LAOST|nr:hypothetical protein LSTR_LSTR013813 [Laodelphax striatellus]
MLVPGIIFIFAYHGLANVCADTGLRRMYELNRDYLPARFKQLGIHGHTDFFVGDHSRPLYIPSDVENEICREHSRLYSDAIENYKVWALKMLDASGKVPSGLLNGHYMDMGNYEECMNLAEEAPYDINYCVVVFRNLTTSLHSPIDWDSIESRPEHTMGGAPFLRPYLRIGICLPASCNIKDLTQHYSNVVSKYKMSAYFDKNSCTSGNERVNLEKKDWFAIFVTILTAMLCVAATVNDYLRSHFNFKTNGAFVDILQCFSLYGNGELILKSTSPDEPLAVLHGLRALSAFYIVMAHHFITNHLFPMINNNKLTTFSRSILSDPFIMSELAVDSFLLMNGLLLVHNTIKRKLTKKKFDVPLFYLHHVFRIVPGYFYQLLIASTVFIHLNDGPLWKYYTNTIREYCQETWWTHLIFLNNYIKPDKQCVPSDWYLAVHMQLVFLSPLILIPIFKGKKIVPLVIVPILFVIANIISISITYFNDFPGTFYSDRLAMREDIFATDYLPTHARISPWLLGILVGYLLCQEGVKISKTQAIYGWVLSTLPFACIVTISRYIHWEGVQHNLTLSSIHNGLNNTAWAILMAWIIVACETGYGGPLKSFLTWRGFQPISRLSYSIYLIGLGIQYGLISIRQNSYSMLIIQSYKDFGGELFLILVFATIGFLQIEAPFIRLNQMMMKSLEAEPIIEIVKETNANDQELHVKENKSTT